MNPPAAARTPLLLLLVAPSLALLSLGVRGQDASAPARDRPGSLASVIDRASASVVRVSLEGGRPRGDAPRWHLLRRVASRDAGAGVALGEGLVLTHASLALFVDPTYTVTDRSGRRHPARVIHVDRARELAVLRADTLRAPAATPGSSEGLLPGHLVVALGDPFGMAVDAQPTATLGVIEGRARLQAAESTFAGEVLLTDAAINPGSEGGALIDVEGRLVGVLGPLVLDRRLEHGLPGQEPHLTGYAVPVEAATAALRAALRPPRQAGFVAKSGRSGVEVVRVEPDGPAAAAGLQPGDVIRAAGGEAVATTADLRTALHASETQLTLKVERSGQRREVVLRWEAAK